MSSSNGLGGALAGERRPPALGVVPRGADVDHGAQSYGRAAVGAAMRLEHLGDALVLGRAGRRGRRAAEHGRRAFATRDPVAGPLRAARGRSPRLRTRPRASCSTPEPTGQEGEPRALRDALAGQLEEDRAATWRCGGDRRSAATMRRLQRVDLLRLGDRHELRRRLGRASASRSPTRVQLEVLEARVALGLGRDLGHVQLVVDVGVEPCSRRSCTAAMASRASATGDRARGAGTRRSAGRRPRRPGSRRSGRR